MSMLGAVLGGGFGSQAAHAAPSASVSMSQSSGPVGTAVTVTGTGFPKKKQGTLTDGWSSVAFTTSASGWFSVSWIIPETTDALIAATATVGTVSRTATFTVTFSPVSVEVPPTPVPEPSPTPAPAPTPGTAPQISTSLLRFGVTTPGGAAASAELDHVASAVGEAPSIVMSYKDFNQPAPIAELDAVAARGATSIITWEPWRWGNGVYQPDFASDRIAAGDFDAYLASWGTALAAWGKPVTLRYAHEANGNWYPWADAANGNSTGDYAAAWRHVHDVVTAAGATNVSWLWSPNVPYTGSTPLTQLYPGAGYVDEVGLDGYNWGASASWSTWTSPSDLFGTGLAQLRAIAPGTPILIAETASAEAGGSKADWNSALIGYLAAQPDVTGFVWFHHNKETDWRIDSSTASAAALRTALGARK